MVKKCMYCDKEVTAAQLWGSEGVKTGRGRYAHTVCIANHRSGAAVTDQPDSDDTLICPICNRKVKELLTLVSCDDCLRCAQGILRTLANLERMDHDD